MFIIYLFIMHILGPQLVLYITLHFCAHAAFLRASRHASPHDASHEAQSSSSSSSQQRQPARPVTFSRVVSRRPAQKFARAPILLGAAPRFGSPASTSGGTSSGPRTCAAAFARPRPRRARSRHVPRAAGLALVVAKSTGRYRARGAGVRTTRRLIPQPL